MAPHTGRRSQRDDSLGRMLVKLKPYEVFCLVHFRPEVDVVAGIDASMSQRRLELPERIVMQWRLSRIARCVLDDIFQVPDAGRDAVQAPINKWIMRFTPFENSLFHAR